MTKKDLHSYERLFNNLIEKAAEFGVELKPDVTITDFEEAVKTAVRKIFPAAKKRGYFFHFKQIIWRRLQKLRLSKRYNTKICQVYKKVMCTCIFAP